MEADSSNIAIQEEHFLIYFKTQEDRVKDKASLDLVEEYIELMEDRLSYFQVEIQDKDLEVQEAIHLECRDKDVELIMKMKVQEKILSMKDVSNKLSLQEEIDSKIEDQHNLKQKLIQLKKYKNSKLNQLIINSIRVKNCCSWCLRMIFTVYMIWYLISSSTSYIFSGLKSSQLQYSFDVSKQFPHEIISGRYNIKFYVNDDTFNELRNNIRQHNKVWTFIFTKI